MKSFFFNLVLVGLFFCLILGCSTDAEPISNDKAVGTWQITAIHNSSPSGPTLGPNTGEVISITFEENGKFTGNTSVNTFKGNYSINDTSLSIEEIVTTEVGDTNFGQAFYQSFNESRNSTTGFSVFTINFQNENSLNLEYAGFKFLTLQR